MEEKADITSLIQQIDDDLDKDTLRLILHTFTEKDSLGNK